MDNGTKKKLTGAGIAALAVIIFGENQIMEMDERLQALEDLHPELVAEEPEEESLSEPPIEEPVEEEGEEPPETEEGEATVEED